jgi:hypothetical protein
MNGKECRATRQEIDESELNQRLSDRALSHLAVCASCGDFRAERASLRELVGSLEPVAAPGDFDMRLRARIANEQDRVRQPFIFRFVTSTPALVTAALVVMLATSLVWFAQRNRSQTPTLAVAPPAAPANEAPTTGQSTTASTGTSATLTPLTGNEARAGQQNRDSNSSRERNNKSALASATSTDYGVSPAKSIKQIEQRAGEVSLSAPLRPMVVSMQDDRGATRKISLPPVSFGAQRLIGSNRIPVSSTNSGSW